MKDLYYILGTDENCSSVEIIEAYSKLAQKFHPDLNPGDKYFEGRFREVREAYEVLGDPQRRSQYDKQYHAFKTHVTGQNPQKLHRQLPKTRFVDIAFTLALLVLTLVFGAYVWQALHGSRVAKPANVATTRTVALHKSKPHKKKRKLRRVWAAAVRVKSKPVTVKVRSSIPVPASRAVPVSPAIPVSRALASADKPQGSAESSSPDLSPGYLYATYLKANETGVVNLRESDAYSSAVIRVIPNNSKVYVLQKGGAYYKIMFDNITGYVPKWTVQGQ